MSTAFSGVSDFFSYSIFRAIERIVDKKCIIIWIWREEDMSVTLLHHCKIQRYKFSNAKNKQKYRKKVFFRQKVSVLFFAW